MYFFLWSKEKRYQKRNKWIADGIAVCFCFYKGKNKKKKAHFPFRSLKERTIK
jgi:hypothetical protein